MRLLSLAGLNMHFSPRIVYCQSAKISPLLALLRQPHVTSYCINVDELTPYEAKFSKVQLLA